MAFPSHLRLSRRHLLAGLPAVLATRSLPALGAVHIGEAADVRGTVNARQLDAVRSLASGAELLVRDEVETEADSFARLDLSGGTRVHLGSRARLLIDSFVAEMGGVLELGEGAMVFDRAEELPKTDIEIRSRFGLIAVRGTTFFAGPNRDAFAVFVKRGVVEVSAAGETRRLAAGDGVDIPLPGAPPNEVKQWGAGRIAEALGSVGFAP